MDQLFPRYLIQEHFDRFNIFSIAQIDNIKELIEHWNKILSSGKLASLKEEEVKSQFVTDFFGKVLGFSPSNCKKWLLREEKKTDTNGKKVDAALGYFYNDKNKDITVAIVEIKDAKTNLYKIQNRKEKITPIEQGFHYAENIEGCKWIIISNMKEIRFYYIDKKDKYQSYLIEELLSDDKLKELLFLFHKDRFIKQNGKSKTDKLLDKIILKNTSPYLKRKTNNYFNTQTHILDQIYNTLKKFEELNFVDPTYLSSIPPFNILKKNVWYYEDNNLFTLNEKFFNLLINIVVDENNIYLKDCLKEELELFGVSNYMEKLEWSFQFLNRCLIFSITAVNNYKFYQEKHSLCTPFQAHEKDTINLNIKILPQKECDCLVCIYNNLKLDKLLIKLDSAENNKTSLNLEYAYGYFLIGHNDYKKTHAILKKLENNYKEKEGNYLSYFIVKYNLSLLQFLIESPSEYDDDKLLENLKDIDLNYIINDELDFNIEPEVQRYLIQIKEGFYRHKIERDIGRVRNQIIKLKTLYDNAVTRHWGPNLPSLLLKSYILYYKLHKSSYFFDEVFVGYKELTQNVLNSFLISYNTKEVGIKKIPGFVLRECLLNLFCESLEKELKDITNLTISDDDKDYMTILFNNFFSSYYESFFEKTHKKDIIKKYIINTAFKEKTGNLAGNIFILLEKVDLYNSKTEKMLDALINFLEVEQELDFVHIRHLSHLIIRKSNIFNQSQVYKILSIAVDGYKLFKTKYSDLINACSIGISIISPNFKISDTTLIRQIIAKCYQKNESYCNLNDIYLLLKITDEKCSELLIIEIENALNTEFDHHLYFKLLQHKLYGPQNKNYFSQLINIVKRYKNEYKVKNEKPYFESTSLFNFILLLYMYKIDFDREDLKIFTNLGEFETWFINPYKYDYSKFDAKWLLAVGTRKYIYEVLKTIAPIKKAVENELKREFNSELANIYFSCL